MGAVEFHFDFGSPNAYLAHLVIPEIEKRTGAKFDYVPILLGGVFKLTHNRSPAESMRGIKNRLEYEELERQRFVRLPPVRGSGFDQPARVGGRVHRAPRSLHRFTSARPTLR